MTHWAMQARSNSGESGAGAALPLAEILHDAHTGGEFREELFFDFWFRGGEGSAFFFLFKKNLRVTNLQFAELLALLRVYTTRRAGGAPPDLLFVTTEMFNQTVKELMASLAPEQPHRPSEAGHRILREQRERCRKFEHLYGLVFERMVVVDAFHGSCVVFVPPSLRLDLKLVCSMSGYVHSCGPSVWVRKVDKARSRELIDRLETHLEGRTGLSSLAVYAHEDFTEFDRELAGELREGLDDVKVWVEKFWMGSDRLGAVLQEISEKLAERLLVLPAGDYRETRADLKANQPLLDHERSFWLLVDHGITPDGSGRSHERFYHCYEQEFKNSSPFHPFDENKPAWRAHTTLPHTLTAAMINIALPYRGSSTVNLCDPFVGSGTTVIEAAKYPYIAPTGSDNDPLVPQLAFDNAEFFGLDAAELRGLLGDLGRAIDLQGGEPPANIVGPTSDAEISRSYEWAKSFVAPLEEYPDREISLADEAIEEFARQPRLARLFFYLGLRSVRRGVGARGTARDPYADGWIREARVLWQQIEQIAKNYAAEDHPESDARVRLWIGSYSLECAPAQQQLKGLRELASAAIGVRDARGLEPDTHDLIVTDPPYGFNTEDDPAELAELYRRVFETLLCALRDGGQLVLALPEHSFTGRETGFFTRRAFIEQLVGALAHDLNLDLLDSREVVPATPDVFRAPYYWESERALRRSILHYRVLRRPRSSDTSDFAAIQTHASVPGDLGSSAKSLPQVGA